jgi:hypothetical protein
VRGNLTKDFPIDAPVEIHPANTAHFHQPTRGLLALILAYFKGCVNLNSLLKASYAACVFE